jgi:hypothetical protein
MEEYNTINIWQKFKQLPDVDQKKSELIMPCAIMITRKYNLGNATFEYCKNILNKAVKGWRSNWWK